MKPVSLIDVASYLPENQLDTEYFAQYAESDELAESIMFKAPLSRRHVAPGETATDMIERAAAPLIERHGAQAIRDVDVIITNVPVPDLFFVGCGADVAHRLGSHPEWVIDLHNGGCVSFVYMLKLARQILQTTDARSALICNAANAAGRIYDQTEVRRKSHAPIPGDGCGIGYLMADDSSPILDVECRHYEDYAEDVSVSVEGGTHRSWWQAGEGQIHLGFNPSKVAKVLARGNRLVPEVASEVCRRLDIKTTDIDTLITNQPNRAFLRNWREALQLPPERHLDTFEDYGNMFGAAIPVTLDEAVRGGRIADGSLLMLAGFAHAGDLAGATAIRWRPAA
jgi:3-oxoacyl-[acyl-carrier-protein] synthase-3